MLCLFLSIFQILFEIESRMSAFFTIFRNGSNRGCRAGAPEKSLKSTNTYNGSISISNLPGDFRGEDIRLCTDPALPWHKLTIQELTALK